MKLSGYEKQAFEAWKECSSDFSIIGFDEVSRRTSLERSKVRRAVRGLARKGIVKFHQMSWSDEGIPHGAGYGLTLFGDNLRAVEK